MHYIKTAEHVSEIFIPSDRPIILVFLHQGLLRKSDGFNPNGGAEYKGVSDFRPICCYTLEMVIDRDMFTKHTLFVYALLSRVTLESAELSCWFASSALAILISRKRSQIAAWVQWTLDSL